MYKYLRHELPHCDVHWVSSTGHEYLGKIPEPTADEAGYDMEIVDPRGAQAYPLRLWTHRDCLCPGSPLTLALWWHHWWQHSDPYLVCDVRGALPSKRAEALPGGSQGLQRRCPFDPEP